MSGLSRTVSSSLATLLLPCLASAQARATLGQDIVRARPKPNWPYLIQLASRTFDRPPQAAARGPE